VVVAVTPRPGVANARRPATFPANRSSAMKLRFLSPMLAALALTTSTLGDEGMWLYENPPRQLLKERHNFDLTDAWLDHLMKSSVRFNSGGSGSFVSEDGMVLSNHHVGADALQKLGTKEKDYLRDGFHAKSLAEELPCVDLELNVLQTIEDVTARVNAAVPANASAEEAFLARRKVISEIEKESLDKTGLRSNVVTLYQGGAHHLYRFKRYTDVRLVFAPEQQAAFFGGDPDNFEFPRWCYDVCFFRAYEDGKPVKVQHFLKWSQTPLNEGDLTFVSGHPGRTSRLQTMAELEYMRDVQFPYTLGRLKRMETLLSVWSDRSVENMRRAKDDLFGVQNSRKARDGGHAGLYDPVLMGRKAEAEKQFKTRLAASGEYPDAQAAYDKIAQAQKVIGQHALRYRLLEAEHGFNCDSYGIARTLLRAGEELPKPNGDRLQEFGDSGKQSLELELFSDKPIYEDYEILKLTDALTFLAEQLGFNDPTVQKVLAGKSPRARASELVLGTKVRDVGVRKKLYEGGAAAVSAANDPLIELARLVDAEARELRKTIEAQDEIKQQAQAAIAKARFALEGTSKYPDATFTLRLAFGPVKGWEEAGRKIPPFTTMAGLYERNAEMGGKPPFDLPPRWVKKKSALDLSTPYNFITTADIIGGNSGSPVVNRAGEFVGIIFDGNLHSLVLDFAYEDQFARALSVDARAIIEALNKVYGAKDVSRELLSGKRKR
jgi:hypothetical protein